MMTAPPTLYATFVSPITQASAGRLVQHLDQMSQGAVGELHLAFQSVGGAIGDGVFLHNYFKASPLNLHLYNAGTVESVAVVAFVGARNRYTSAHGVFMIHPSSFTPETVMSAEDHLARGRSLKIDDDRSRDILKGETSIPPGRLSNLDQTFVASEAVKFGIAKGLREFQVPAGNKILDLTIRPQ